MDTRLSFVMLQLHKALPSALKARKQWGLASHLFYTRQIVCMKFVTLIITVMMFSFSADAQTNHQAAGKKAVAKVQQETKSKKVKSPAPKPATGTNDVTTLTDERSHKAKWTFDEMLKRRLEIDAEEGEREQRKD